MRFDHKVLGVSEEEFDALVATAYRMRAKQLFGVGAFWFAVGWLVGTWL